MLLHSSITADKKDSIAAEKKAARFNKYSTYLEDRGHPPSGIRIKSPILKTKRMHSLLSEEEHMVLLFSNGGTR